MDFPGGAVTNIHVIGEYSNIYWRIYTEEQAVADNRPEAPANGYTILKHLSWLKDLELRLRNLGCLVSCCPSRLGLWVFSATSDFEQLRPLCPDAEQDFARIVVNSSLLKVSASGNASSRELVKNLSTEPHSSAYSTEPQKPIDTFISSEHTDEDSASIYASFITAVSATISLQLIQHQGAIPLGLRTLFTAVERDGYANPKINNDDPLSVASLTTLHIQLTSVGKLTISSHTVAQLGITRLLSPWDPPGEILNVEPGTDVWLSPNGTIARLVSANPNSPVSPLPNTPGTANTARGIQWKSAVLEWLRLFELHTPLSEEEAWVEVEVCEPPYATLSEGTWSNQESQPVVTLQRILWPARYCFVRTKSMQLGDETGDTAPIMGDPLDFAAEWYDMRNSLPAEEEPKSHPDSQQHLLKGQGGSPPKPDFPEGIESLARVAQYPDLQAASLVYPTPPDAPATTGFSNLNPSEPFGDDPNIGVAQQQKEGIQEAGNRPSSKDPLDPNVTIDFGPSAGLVVGSGLYDTNDDDDLFGEMNEEGLGAKGITDADFNFFDDPGFGGMEDNTPAGNIQATPQTTAELEDPKTQAATDPKISEEHPTSARPAGHESPPSIDRGNTPAKPDEEAALVKDLIPPRKENRQTISPPLSPVEVKKILFPGPGRGNHSGNESRKQTHYSPVAFDLNMTNWDRKYGSDGKFWFSSPNSVAAANPTDSTSDIPTIGIPSRAGKSKVLADASAKLLNDYGTPSNSLKQGLRSASISSSDMSDDSDGMASENDEQPVVLTSLKRKRTYSNPESPISEEPPKGIFFSIISDWSMAGYFSALHNQALPLLPGKGQQVQIAQLLVDQVAYSSLNHGRDGRITASDFEDEVHFLGVSLEDVAIIGEAEKLDLKGFASLQNSGTSTPVADGLISRQAAQQNEAGISAITKVSPPHLCVRRGKNYLEALPPVVSFWETFGLEPAHGPKDISAYCIHPRNAAESADDFLERIGLLYSNCNLGNHARGDRSKAFEQGLVSWDTISAGEASYSAMMQSLKSFSGQLGTALASNRPSKENIVIYIINPFSHAAALVDICTAFWHLLQMYAVDIDKGHSLQADELVLQVIPSSFLVSVESIVVPSQTEYLRLALEVYSRCSLKDPGSGIVSPEPPMVLAESLPKSINFKLAPEMLSPLLEERCLHVACSKSLDQRWITVAWSNNTGSLQRTMSYCLRFRNSTASRNTSEIRNEIWTKTTNMMDGIQARWTVIVVNTEPVDQEEVDTWVQLAEQHNKAKSVPLELAVMNANTTPDLGLELPTLPMPMSVVNPQPSSPPAATPSASGSVPSPDQAVNSPAPVGYGNAPPNAPTPAELPLEAESESLLVDICDESWAVVLSHRLNNSPHLMEYRPALASGYLLRRKGPTDGEGVFSMNVNLVYTQRAPSSHEAFLRDTLKMYRDLATLSRARGTYNVQQNTLPWHIATALRGQEMLSYVL